MEPVAFGSDHAGIFARFEAWIEPILASFHPAYPVILSENIESKDFFSTD